VILKSCLCLLYFIDIYQYQLRVKPRSHDKNLHTWANLHMCKFTWDLLACVKVNLLSVHMIFFFCTHLMVKHGRFRSLSMPKKEIVSILCGSGFGHWSGSWKKDMKKRTFYGLVWPYCSWDIWRWPVDWKFSNEDRNLCIFVSRSGREVFS
jgi:hypothetical protein